MSKFRIKCSRQRQTRSIFNRIRCHKFYTCYSLCTLQTKTIQFLVEIAFNTKTTVLYVDNNLNRQIYPVQICCVLAALRTVALLFFFFNYLLGLQHTVDCCIIDIFTYYVCLFFSRIAINIMEFDATVISTSVRFSQL